MPVSQRFLLLLCFSTASVMGGLLTIFASFHVMLMLRALTPRPELADAIPQSPLEGPVSSKDHRVLREDVHGHQREILEASHMALGQAFRAEV